MDKRNFIHNTYVLHLDGRCTQKCLICMKKDAIERGRILRLETVRGVIWAASKKGYNTIDFYGGEPLSYRYIIDAMEYAHSLGLRCFLATNATRFSSKTYAKKFFSCVCVDEVRTTVHSHRSDVHDAITQVPGSLRKTVQGIRTMVGMSVPLSVNVVITSMNYRQLADAVKYIVSCGVKRISFSGIVMEGRVLQHERLAVSLSKMQKPLLQALKLCKKLRIDFKIIKLPVCIAGEIKIKPHQIVPENDPEHFTKLSRCSGCSQRKRCVGIERYFLKRFGAPRFCAPLLNSS